MRLFNFLQYVANVAAVLSSRDSSYDGEVINSCNEQLAELSEFNPFNELAG